MLPLLSILPLAQTPPPPPKPAPQEIVQRQPVLPLPGQLDNVPMFNSNSPEWVKLEGILLSTFPPTGKKVPAAHLNFPFQGRFDLFAHHFSHTPKDLQTLYIGVILHNPTKKVVRVQVLQAASQLMQNAPYVTLPTYVENPKGDVYSGHGDRAVNDVLRGIRQADIPAQLAIPPGGSRMLMNHPIPVRDLEKPINGRSTLMRLRSNGTVYAASLAMYAKKNADGSDRAPTQLEWEALLNTGGLAGPRDTPPSPPQQTTGKFIYSRVAGVSAGSAWKARLVDKPNAQHLTIPESGKAISYPISSLKLGTLGTGQVQTAKMLVRYPDTAYEAHGNYGVEYNLSLPLMNSTNKPETVSVTLETPLKEDKLSKGGLRFRKPPQDFPIFRGTVRLRYNDDQGKPQTRYVHLWHRTGQVLDPLLTLRMAPKTRRQVQVDLIYPPDATAPQALTVRTLDTNSANLGAIAFLSAIPMLYGIGRLI